MKVRRNGTGFLALVAIALAFTMVATEASATKKSRCLKSGGIWVEKRLGRPAQCVGGSGIDARVITDAETLPAKKQCQEALGEWGVDKATGKLVCQNTKPDSGALSK